jgi:hypothetical protein
MGNKFIHPSVIFTKEHVTVFSFFEANQIIAFFFGNNSSPAKYGRSFLKRSKGRVNTLPLAAFHFIISVFCVCTSSRPDHMPILPKAELLSEQFSYRAPLKLYLFFYFITEQFFFCEASRQCSHQCCPTELHPEQERLVLRIRP